MVTSNCTVFDPDILARGANGNVWEGGEGDFSNPKVGTGPEEGKYPPSPMKP